MSASAAAPARPRAPLLLASVLIVSTTALLYELAAATIASYLVGSSALAFSMVLGVYLSAMGAGALGARGLDARSAIRRFVWVELALACAGAALIPSLLAAFLLPRAAFVVTLVGAVALVGALAGLELPLLILLVRREAGFSRAVSRALAADYAGALLASLAFPLVLVPTLGLVRATMATAALNALVAAATAWSMRDELRGARAFVAAAGLIAAAVLALAPAVDGWTAHWTD